MIQHEEHQHLLQRIVHHFSRDGWRVTHEPPADWRGSVPELLLERQGTYRAVRIERLPVVMDRKTADVWEETLRNPGTSLTVVVRDRKSFNAARAAASSRALAIDLQLYSRKRTRPDDNDDLFDSHPGRQWGMIVTALVVLIVFLLLIGPIIRNTFHVHDFYRPFDRERQLHFQQQLDEE